MREVEWAKGVTRETFGSLSEDDELAFYSLAYKYVVDHRLLDRIEGQEIKVEQLGGAWITGRSQHQPPQPRCPTNPGGSSVLGEGGADGAPGLLAPCPARRPPAPAAAGSRRHGASWNAMTAYASSHESSP
jgi:hypothetical protein